MNSAHFPIYRHQNKYAIWYLFIILSIIEFVLFKYYVLHNIADFYPTNHDQNSYLLSSYRIYENIKHQGLIAGLAHADFLATGALFPIEAAFLYLLFGVSRLSALSLNFIYFVALQFFALLAIRSVSAKNTFAYIFLGLIFCINTPLLDAGSLMDFRMDFVAFCMYGIFACLAVKSDIFYDRKWSLMVTLAACSLILLRCLTVIYLALTFATLFIYLFSHLKHPQNKSRLIHLSLSSSIIAIVVLPYLWLNKTALYNYYVGNHILGDERFIRALEMKVTHISSSIVYYPTSVFLTHVGTLGLTLGALVLISYLFFYFLGDKTHDHHQARYWKMGFIFLLICIFSPLIILTADTMKSAVVGSIIVMPLLLLLLWCCLYIDSKLIPSKNSRLLFNMLAAVTIVSGLYHQVQELHHYPSKAKREAIAPITKMYQDIGDYALAKHWPAINLSVDQVNDYLTAAGLAVIYYETRGHYLQSGIEKLGASIFAINQAEALASLKRSNVVILNLKEYPKDSVYPFNQTVSMLKPLLYATAEHQFVRLGDYSFKGSVYRVYVTAQ